jgi:hypothetical protein
MACIAADERLLSVSMSPGITLLVLCTVTLAVIVFNADVQVYYSTL